MNHAEVMTPLADPGRLARRPEKGCGLGLFMVSRTVHQLGGAIVVDTAPGAGSTFRLSLPLPDS
jgi:signal transduction histidine kinase